MQSLCVEFITLLWRMEKKKIFKIIPKALLERSLLVSLSAKILEFIAQGNVFKSYEEKSSKCSISDSAFFSLLV